jgi:cytidylate kinase
MIAPVVVKPETASKMASVIDMSSLLDSSSGTAPASPSTTQNSATTRKPSRNRSSRTFLRTGLSAEHPGRARDLARDLDIGFQLEGERNRVFLAGEEVTDAIRTPRISEGSSRVSTHPEVRAALLDLQRRLGAVGGVVVEGRDVGTVVFPGADAKFFLTASSEVRARRRFAELRAAGRPVDEAATLAELTDRDRRDETRQTAPLRQAPDATLVDSSDRDLDEVTQVILAEVQRRAASVG